MPINLKYPAPDLIEELRESFQEEFPDIIVMDIGGSGRYYANYYIQFQLKNIPNIIHYEYVAINRDCGVLELHLEPNPSNVTEKNRLRALGNALIHKVIDKNENITGGSWFGLPNGKFSIQNKPIYSIDKLVESFRELYEATWPDLSELLDSNMDISLVDAGYPKQTKYETIDTEPNQTVSVRMMNLAEVMRLNLTLPEYQREYCWEDQEISSLWQSLLKIKKDRPYHLGTLILHNNGESYDIIDGQQRLITLSIILWALGHNEVISLLNERYDSIDAQDHISNCKYIVKNLILQYRQKTVELKENVLSMASFAVIVVDKEHLELAYTFFTNQNSQYFVKNLTII